MRLVYSSINHKQSTEVFDGKVLKRYKLKTKVKIMLIAFLVSKELHVMNLFLQNKQ